MKKLYILTLLVFGALAANAQSESIKWVTINELEALQKQEPRKVLIDVYTKWCGPCKMMMAQTFTNKDVIKLINEKFYAVKFNAEGNEIIKFKGYDFSNKKYVAEKPGRNGTHEFTTAIAPVQGRIAYPTIVYMDENLNIISPVQGFMKPLQILPLLGYISEGAYATQAYEKYLEAKK